jgi:short-subunit dehydrogenase
MFMDNVGGKWALVTGASSGFGVEFAKLLAELSSRRVQEYLSGLAAK